MAHDVDAIVVGVGSAGTLTGLTRFFRACSRGSSSCSPIRSARSCAEYIEAGVVGTAGWTVEGIGEDFVPAIADLSASARPTRSPTRKAS